MNMSYKYMQILAIIIMAGFIAVPQAYAFIAFPPITTLSIALIVLHFGIFAISFLGSILFQGWYVKRKLGIKFSESMIQALKLKMLFMLYALPILVLSDMLGMTTIGVVDNLPIPGNLQENLWFKGILYFFAGLFVLVSVTSIIEIYLFSRKWKEVPLSRIRSVIINTNVAIFSFALVVIVLAKELWF